MKLFEYKDYNHYVAEQTKANKRKLNRQGVWPETIELIKNRIPVASRILCHGTRAGHEQQFFKDFYPEAYVIGTEISDTAEQFPMTMQWDAQEPHSELVDFDILYTNIFDHVIYPQRALETWKEQSSNIILELHGVKKSRASDPLSISPEEFLELCGEVGLYVEDEWERIKPKKEGSPVPTYWLRRTQ